MAGASTAGASTAAWASSGALGGDIPDGPAGRGLLPDGLLVDMIELLTVSLVLPFGTWFGAVVEFVVSGQQLAIARNGGQKFLVGADVGDGADSVNGVEQRHLVGQ